MTVTDLAGVLEQSLEDPASMRAISTRVLLRTGVNLLRPRPEQNADKEIIARVRAVLTEMGYRI